MAHNSKEHVCPIVPSKSLITYSIHVNTYIAQFKFSFYLKIASNSVCVCVCVSYLSHLNSGHLYSYMNGFSIAQNSD